jgi:hypothetical protein
MGVIAGADKGSAVHVFYTEAVAIALVLPKLLRGNECFNKELAPVGLKILADGDDIASGAV